jgi:hypothetical protein
MSLSVRYGQIGDRFDKHCIREYKWLASFLASNERCEHPAIAAEQRLQSVDGRSGHDKLSGFHTGDSGLRHSVTRKLGSQSPKLCGLESLKLIVGDYRQPAAMRRLL